MTFRAVLLNRCMIPKEGSSGFRVAFPALVVDRQAADRRHRGSAMRIVAVIARHLPELDGVIGPLIETLALGRMTTQTSIGLVLVDQGSIVSPRFVNGMTRGAIQLHRLVYAAIPVGHIESAMAARTRAGDFGR